jgi:type IX secretion system PorP/SprF family membrane protein
MIYNCFPMKRMLPTLVLFLVALTGLSAQDEAVFNHYVQNPILLNPAAAGFLNEYTVQANARAAWSGFEDSPKTVALRLNGPVGESFGIGVGVFSESAAQINRLKGQIDVAFRFGFGNEVKGVPAFQAAFGFFSQFQRLTIDPGIINNPQYEPGDEVITRFLDGKNVFDAGIGIYGSYLDKVFGGFTINNLVANRLGDISGSSTDEGINFTFLLGQRFRIEESNVNLTPSIMLRDVQGAPFMMDFNLQAGFLDDQFIAGLSYRYLGAVGMLLGTKINSLQIYYSFDLGFGGLQTYSNGSHELTVGYSISRADIKESRQRKAREDNRR